MFPSTDSPKNAVDMFPRTDTLKWHSFYPLKPCGSPNSTFARLRKLMMRGGEVGLMSGFPKGMRASRGHSLVKATAESVVLIPKIRL